MNIHALSESNRLEKGRKIGAAKGPSGAESRISPKADSVELGTRKIANITLESIKAKVKSGFYNSDAVTDDVTDKLAAMFEKRL